jgi:DNA-binding FadR family transcriptional regulator
MTPIHNILLRRSRQRDLRLGSVALGDGSGAPRDNDSSNGKKLYVVLAERLGRDIVAGRRAPGSLLPNAVEMCAEFAISRTTLREAYSILIAKGLIEARAKTGTRVRSTAEWNALDPEVFAWRFEATPSRLWLEELLVLRQIVEPAAAALAASVASQSAFDRIAEAYDRMGCREAATEDLVRADLDFHMAILEASGNRLLVTISTAICCAIARAFRPMRRRSARIDERRLLQHRQVLEAIRDHAPELARNRMSLLLRRSEERLKNLESADAASRTPLSADGTWTGPTQFVRAEP